MKGMYDNIRCEHQIEDNLGEIDFQTKSLDKILDTFIINRDGELLWSGRYSYEHYPKHLSTYDYTGKIEFHTMASKERWLSYLAIFLHGKVVSIEMTDQHYSKTKKIMELMKRIWRLLSKGYIK